MLFEDETAYLLNFHLLRQALPKVGNCKVFNYYVFLNYLDGENQHL